MKKAVFCDIGNTSVIEVTDVDDPKVALNVNPEVVVIILVEEEDVPYIQFYYDEKRQRVLPRVLRPSNPETTSTPSVL